MPIHPSALIDPSVQLGPDCSVGPGACLEAGVRLGPGCQIAAYAILRRGTCLGASVRVDSFAVLGGDPQSLSFDSAIESAVQVGDRTVIREAVTINRASASGAATIIGADCFLMANAHVAHDCQLGDGVILANNAMLAGHISIGDKTFVGGGAGIHQFCRIGAYCMIAGNASITADVPPYVMAAERSEAHGLNLVGLKRAGFAPPEIQDLKRCYRAIFFGGGNLRKKAEAVARDSEIGKTPAAVRFLGFFKDGRRGFIQSTYD